MDIKKKPCLRSYGLEDGDSEADIGNKAPVHHVQVQPVGTGLLNAIYLLREAGKVCCQKRGRDACGMS